MNFVEKIFCNQFTVVGVLRASVPGGEHRSRQRLRSSTVDRLGSSKSCHLEPVSAYAIVSKEN